MFHQHDKNDCLVLRPYRFVSSPVSLHAGGSLSNILEDDQFLPQSEPTDRQSGRCKYGGELFQPG